MDIEHIKWIDSSGYEGWVDHTIHSDCLQKIETVGFVVSEKEDRITVTSSISDSGYVNCPITIPKSSIIERKKL